MRLDADAWLEHLDQARTLALAGDVEGVHQVRVSARRLRVWLSFKKRARLEEELRWLCRELALQRDLDVFGEVFTEAALSDLRQRAVEQAVTALESDRWFRLREALKDVRSPKRKRAKKTLRKLERKLDERRALAHRDGPALHRLRRSLRRVRYAREWLGRDTGDIPREQERLGAVCDLLALEGIARREQAEVPAQLSSAIERAFDWLEANS